jgi:hypothetical protein
MLLFACKIPLRNPDATTKLPIGPQIPYTSLICSALESIRPAEYTRPEDTSATAKSAENESDCPKNAKEYAKNTYGMNNKNKTAKNIPTAILPF